VIRDAGIDVATRNLPAFSLETIVSHAVVVSLAGSQLARSVVIGMVAGTPAYTSR
jgi:hypothetical protein